MKLYALIQEDRHAEADVEIYSIKEKAVERAWALAKQFCRKDEEPEESEVDGWILCLYYSFEGDCVRVLEKTLDKAE